MRVLSYWQELIQRTTKEILASLSEKEVWKKSTGQQTGSPNEPGNGHNLNSSAGWDYQVDRVGGRQLERQETG